MGRGWERWNLMGLGAACFLLPGRRTLGGGANEAWGLFMGARLVLWARSRGGRSWSVRGWTQERPRPNGIGEMILKGLDLARNCLG